MENWPFIDKGQMKKLGATIAGEMSGHLFFTDWYLSDGAVYAICRLVDLPKNINCGERRCNVERAACRSTQDSYYIRGPLRLFQCHEVQGHRKTR
jgi:phosphomannomutase